MPLPRSVKVMNMDHFQPRHCMSDTFRGFSFIHDDFRLPERKENEVENYWNSIEEDGESASECASSKYELEMTTNASSVAAHMDSDKKKRPPRKRNKKKKEGDEMLTPTQSPGQSESGWTPAPSESVRTPAPSEHGKSDVAAHAASTTAAVRETFFTESGGLAERDPMARVRAEQSPSTTTRLQATCNVAETERVPRDSAPQAITTPPTAKPIMSKPTPVEDWQAVGVSSAKKGGKVRRQLSLNPVQEKLRNGKTIISAELHGRREGNGASAAQATRSTSSKSVNGGVTQTLSRPSQPPPTSSQLHGSWAHQKPVGSSVPPPRPSTGVPSRLDSNVAGKNAGSRGTDVVVREPGLFLSPSTDWRQHNMSPATTKAVIGAWPSLADFPAAGESPSQPKTSNLQGAWAAKKR